MTHKTNLFAGWWLYTGLIGLGVALFLFGYGGLYARLGLAVLVLLAVAALAAFFSGRGPTVTAATILSESGVTVTVTGPGHGDAANLISWEEIAAVRVVPQPGYWETEIQTSRQPDVWLSLGRGLELAEEIAEVAGLPYREDLNTSANMGVEHYWTRSDA